MPIAVEPSKPRTQIHSSVSELAKAVAAAVPLIGVAEPSGFASALSAGLPSIISGAVSLWNGGSHSLQKDAWILLHAAHAAALLNFFSHYHFDRPPNQPELEILIASIIDHAYNRAQTVQQTVSLDFFLSPLKVDFFRDSARRLPHELKIYSDDINPIDIRRQFEKDLFDGLVTVRNSDPNRFRNLELSLSGPLENAADQRSALAYHHGYLIRGFTQQPIFGQEETGITLSDLYVKQRAIWNTREPIPGKQTHAEKITRGISQDFFQEEGSADFNNWCYPLHVEDLHTTLNYWLANATPDDAIRVVAGGPGSGKSTFARALAVEQIDTANYDVLFVPLQEIEPSGTFQSRIENLFKGRTELGFDRAASPLSWLGQREANGAPPTKPLLLICDGLDEIAPPDSVEATNVTADFIQGLSTWLSNRNSGGLFVCAVILGRTISAQEAFNKLGISNEALLRVGGLLPLKDTMEWRAADSEAIAFGRDSLVAEDQRAIFWRNWSAASGINDSELPLAIKASTPESDALKDLTTEPLLLYLLIWTGYLDKDWKKAAENRNYVYGEIFSQIYYRKWGLPKNTKQSNRQRGGHTGTRDLDEGDFFLLQEALGLASWPTGGRTISSESYTHMLHHYLELDKYDDLKDSASASLKSVALQSYTRSTGGPDAGFEFVHKSLGEYLIGRALVQIVSKSLARLRDRKTDSRCTEAASIVCKLAGIGPFTTEIRRFFNDELKLRYAEKGQAISVANEQLSPLVSWMLRNGSPVHMAPNYNERPTFAQLDLAERRCMNVVWSFFQQLGRIALSDHLHAVGEKGRQNFAGSLRVDWPNSQSFLSLFQKLSSREFVAENKYIPNFDFLDLKYQAVTDYTFGSVLFSSKKDEGYIPESWIGASFCYCDLSGALFYRAHLASAAIMYSNLDDCSLMDAHLNSADLSYSTLRNARLTDAVCYRLHAKGCDFSASNLAGIYLYRSDVSDAKFVGTHFGSIDSEYRDTENPSILDSCDLESALFISTSFDNSVLSGCNIQRTRFNDCDLRNSVFIDNDLRDAVLENVTITPSQSRELVGRVLHGVNVAKKDASSKDNTSHREYLRVAARLESGFRRRRSQR